MAKAYFSTVIDAPADEGLGRGPGTSTRLPALGTASMVRVVRDRGRQGRRRGRGDWSAHACGRREDPRAAARALGRGALVHLRLPDDAVRGVDNYNATIRVTPVTDGDKAFVEWWVTFDCDPDQHRHWIDFYATDVFQDGARGAEGVCAT